MDVQMEMEVLKKSDKAILVEILKQTSEEMDRVNEECNVLLEILMRKRYKNISETKPFMLRVGKKRYRDNDGGVENEEDLSPPAPLQKKITEKARIISSSEKKTETKSSNNEENPNVSEEEGTERGEVNAKDGENEEGEVEEDSLLESEKIDKNNDEVEGEEEQVDDNEGDVEVDRESTNNDNSNNNNNDNNDADYEVMEEEEN